MLRLEMGKRKRCAYRARGQAVCEQLRMRQHTIAPGGELLRGDRGEKQGADGERDDEPGSSWKRRHFGRPQLRPSTNHKTMQPVMR